MSEAIEGSRGLNVAGNWGLMNLVIEKPMKSLNFLPRVEAYYWLQDCPESQACRVASNHTLPNFTGHRPSPRCQWKRVLVEAMTCGDKCKSRPEHSKEVN